jgi:hypothetical protein
MKLISFFFFIALSLNIYAQNTEINPNTLGLPVRTTQQRVQISQPQKGNILFDSDLKALVLFNGEKWVILKENENENIEYLKLGEFPENSSFQPIVNIDQAGNIIIIGVIFGEYRLENQNFNSLNYKGVIAKFNSNGNLLWHNYINTTDEVRMNTIKTDSLNNIYFAGSYRSNISYQTASFNSSTGFDAFLIKLNPDGNLVWSYKPSSGGYDEVSMMQVGKEGVYFVGKCWGDLNLGNGNFTPIGNMDVFAGKINYNGGEASGIVFGSTELDDVHDFKIDLFDNIVFNGVFRSSFSVGSVILSNPSLMNGTYVLKFNKNFETQWVKTVLPPSNYHNHNSKIETDNYGNIYYILSSYSELYAFNTVLNQGTDHRINLGKLDPQGNLLWNKTDGSGGLNTVWNINICNNQISVIIKAFTFPTHFLSGTIYQSGFYELKYELNGKSRALINLNNNTNSNFLSFSTSKKKTAVLNMGQTFSSFYDQIIPLSNTYPKTLGIIFKTN